MWPYKCVFEGRLHDRFADPSRSGIDTQRVVNRLLGRFGAGRLAHVHGAPVGTAEVMRCWPSRMRRNVVQLACSPA